MSLLREIKQRRARKALRVRSKFVKKDLPRVSVYKSLKYIYGQIIDDITGQTLVSCSSLEVKDITGNKKDKAKDIGLELAKRTLKKGITSIRFDRGRFLYHGRIKAFAEGLREGGLKF